MIKLDLTKEQLTVLIEVLESAHADLRMEIRHTDRRSFREMLQERKRIVARVLDSLRPTKDALP